MTAEIGILNKNAVVLAADSAVTIGYNRKVFNTANKIFQLSYKDPVGIMVFNNASWMGFPLELIIKEYRENFSTSFESLEEYAKDFYDFIHQHFLPKLTDDDENSIIEHKTYEILNIISDAVTDIINEKISDSSINRPNTKEEENTIFESILIELLDTLLGAFKDKEKSLQLKSLTFLSFKKRYSKIFDGIINGFILSNEIKDKTKFKQLASRFLFSSIMNDIEEDDEFTGLVFAGYGKNDLYPSFVETRLAETINKKIKYVFKNKRSINNQTTAIVAPFAQREMVDTFFRGIDPNLHKFTHETLSIQIEELVTKTNKNIHKKAKEKIASDFMEKYTNDLKQQIDEYYIKPIVNTIEVLRKEELAEVAESLVGITSLKRKASLEIETVGGPIDIALITKHDGFVWVKRKENINPEINHLYFEREREKK